MHRYIFKRLFSMVPVLVGVAFVIFTMLYLTPGDPAKLILGEQASEEALTQFRAAQGLNDPFLFSLDDTSITLFSIKILVLRILPSMPFSQTSFLHFQTPAFWQGLQPFFQC